MSENQAPQQTRTHSGTRRFDAFIAVMIDSLTGFFNNMATQAAASVGYYFLFSIFPLFLFVVIFLSYFLDISFIENELAHFVQETIPGAEILISENLQNILQNRGSTSILASISLLWSGSGMISSIITNVQKAFPETRRRGFFINRALAIALILITILLIAGVMTFSLVFNVSDALAYFNIQLTRSIQIVINIISSYVLPMIFLYMAGFALYYMIPTARVDRGAARISAAWLAIVWRLFTLLFGKYILSPMNRYDLVYGSVTVIVLLLLYIYFSSFIILYFAHLTAAITHYRQRRAGLLASAPINPEPIKPKKATRGKKKNKGGNQANTRTLSDPVVLDPNAGKSAPSPSVASQIWELIKSLFRWK